MPNYFPCSYHALAFAAGLLSISSSATATEPASFIAVEMKAAPLIVHSGSEGMNPFDWRELDRFINLTAPYPQNQQAATVYYLKEAIFRMTGKEPEVLDQEDGSQGIVLLLLKDAPDDLKNDAEVQRALRNTGQDDYNANEAYYLRSEPRRQLVIANTQAGLQAGVVDLLESVGYEVLGMGPNWTHVPDFHQKTLAFSVCKAGRPGFYFRSLQAMSGQERGVGTLRATNELQLSDPNDEPVGISYLRWRIGTRQEGSSMPSFPGHRLQDYHSRVIAAMRESGQTAGFLSEQTHIGADAERPSAAAENAGYLWINSDPDGEAAGKVYLSDGTAWKPQGLSNLQVNLDLSVPLVRDIILADVKRQAEAHFEKHPDQPFICPTDPEDGIGYRSLARLLKNKNWYPEYLSGEGVQFGQPYRLNGFKGLEQPTETWNPQSVSDTVFGFNNWLLREYDKWIDSRPESEQVTVAGNSKKALIRLSLYSYNFHDVPPDFNLDSRIRVAIAGFPKNRGRGKWKMIRNQRDTAEAFRILLPREPSGLYYVLGIARYHDHTLEGIKGSPSAQQVQREIRAEYDAGFRGYQGETDFNFGKYGLWNYLLTKALWDPTITSDQLDEIRDRWLQRSFGSVWREMKAYYDFMTGENYKFNAPHSWATAVHLIEAAAKKLDGSKEPEALRRLDDVKQFWYFYYLLDSDQAKLNVAAFKEFLWKGQMSYMTAMQMVAINFFKNGKVNGAIAAAGPEYNRGPAHYTHEETEAWWSRILDRWQVIPVASFADAQLADGTKGADVDLNDLVRVEEFHDGVPRNNGFHYNSGYLPPANFLTTAAAADEEIGFQLFWPWNPADGYYRDRDVFYGINYWNPAEKKWEELVDITMAFKHSEPRKAPNGRDYQWIQVRYKAPRAGTYRIDLSSGGNQATMTTLDFDFEKASPEEKQYGATEGKYSQTYFSTLRAGTQSNVWFYIPKETRSLDLECSNDLKKQLTFHRGLPATGMTATRTVDISARGTHTIELEPEEAGSLVSMKSDGFHFPYLYSIPLLWAKSPASLLVPRAVAKADELTAQ